MRKGDACSREKIFFTKKSVILSASFGKVLCLKEIQCLTEVFLQVKSIIICHTTIFALKSLNCQILSVIDGMVVRYPRFIVASLKPQSKVKTCESGIENT